MLQTGTIINNRYRIVKLLGQGGFGAVYRAWDINLNQARALKMNLETSAEAQRQFQREASTLAALSHPNLPRVVDYFFVEGQGQFLVMDYVDGEDLEAILTREGQLPPEQAMPIITQVADALIYLHQQDPPIIHRDIKPANIRVLPNGQVFLVDFGLVKIYDEQLRTTIGARAVTPGYSPPEQYGQGNTDARTDVYALAATLYTILTGEEPQESVQRIIDDQIKPVTQVSPTVLDTVSTTLLQAMSLNPSQRYQTVNEFMQSLQEAVSVESVEPSSDKSPIRADRKKVETAPTAMAVNYAGRADAPISNGVHPMWWVSGTAVFLAALFFLIILPNTQQQTAQQLALQITEQANSTRLAQNIVASTVQAAETSTAQYAVIATADAAQATRMAQATEATGTARAEVQAANTARAEARATSAAEATATQQANATATMRAQNNAVATITAQGTRVFGPGSGSLPHRDDRFVSLSSAGVSLRNFVVEATFFNPYSTAQGEWDYGFFLRHTVNYQMRVGVNSDGMWEFSNRIGDETEWIDSGSVPGLRLESDITNLIRLIARNDRGWLYINDVFITELDLSSRGDSGDVLIATGMFGYRIAGEETRYTDFTVWELP